MAYPGKSKHPQLTEAGAAVRNRQVPAIALDPYEAQFFACQSRGIALDMTIRQWWQWWQRDDGAGVTRWSRRGRRAGQLMMLRHGDSGPYRLGNVYAGTPADNLADKQRHTHSMPSPRCIAAGVAALREYHARAVIAPDGTRYPMIKDAAAAVGVSRRTIERWIDAGRWRYA